jgi:TPR repeat protein
VKRKIEVKDTDLEKTFELASIYKSEGNYQAAVEVLIANFDGKKPEVANLLGYLFQDKKFSGYNLDSSIFYYEIAAKAGNSYGQHALGAILKEKGDLDKAIFWIKKASESGVGQCSYIMFHHYKRNSEKLLAENYLLRAIEQNYAPAIQRFAVRSIIGTYGWRKVIPGLRLWISNISNLKSYARGLDLD